MLAAYYLDIRALHAGCAALSGALFAVRGALRLQGSPSANHASLRRLSYAIDTTLLLAAIALMLILHQYPFVNGWLTAKLLLLLLYIALGIVTLKGARTTLGRSLAFLAALGAFGAIVTVAVVHVQAG